MVVLKCLLIVFRGTHAGLMDIQWYYLVVFYNQRPIETFILWVMESIELLQLQYCLLVQEKYFLRKVIQGCDLWPVVSTSCVLSCTLKHLSKFLFSIIFQFHKVKYKKPRDVLIHTLLPEESVVTVTWDLPSDYPGQGNTMRLLSFCWVRWSENFSPWTKVEVRIKRCACIWANLIFPLQLSVLSQ